jgi:hydrogenase maturation protease
VNTRIIGLGNSILTDDGVGIYTVREIARRSAAAGFGKQVDVVESEVGGFDLMELMAGWKRVILVDSIQFAWLKSGTVIRIDPDDLYTSLRLRSVHDVDLPTVLQLGHRLGLAMPKSLTIFGIQVEDMYTISECLTQTAELGMKKAVGLILEELAGESSESNASQPPALAEAGTDGR